MTPPASATQSIDSARAGAAFSSSSTKGSSRIVIQLARRLGLFGSLEVIDAFVPLAKRLRKGDRGSHKWTGFRRSRYRGAQYSLLPVRPETLRRHLSMALPLSKSRRHQRITFRSFSKPSGISAIPLHAAGRKSIG